jgi:hypothetical protein
MDWRALPQDLEEAILTNLSLVELARVSRTKSFFLTIFHKRRAQGQKALRELAAERFGSARITRIITLVERFYKRQLLDPCLADSPTKTRCWIYEDGNCRKERPEPEWSSGRYLRHIATEVEVEPFGGGADAGIQIRILTQSWSQVTLLLSHNFRADIFVYPRSNKDFRGLGLLQALLSEGLARIIVDAGQRMFIHITGSNMGFWFTQEGLKSMIAPLVPFAPPFSLAGAAWAGGACLSTSNVSGPSGVSPSDGTISLVC